MPVLIFFTNSTRILWMWRTYQYGAKRAEIAESATNKIANPPINESQKLGTTSGISIWKYTYIRNARNVEANMNGKGSRACSHTDLFLVNLSNAQAVGNRTTHGTRALKSIIRIIMIGSQTELNSPTLSPPLIRMKTVAIKVTTKSCTPIVIKKTANMGNICHAI